jgi:uncharacterized protein (UPF0332 family)
MMSALEPKAVENWNIGCHAFDDNCFHTATSRFYYSLYQMAKDFLVRKNEISNSAEIQHDELADAIINGCDNLGIRLTTTDKAYLKRDYNWLHKKRKDADYCAITCITHEVFIDEIYDKVINMLDFLKNKNLVTSVLYNQLKSL